MFERKEPVRVNGTHTFLLGTYSELVDDSSFVVRSRRTTNGEKILVDVTEISPPDNLSYSVGHHNAENQARQAARFFGAGSTDFSIIRQFDEHVKVSDGLGHQYLMLVRRSCYAFPGVI
jgi:hypothetical protein